MKILFPIGSFFPAQSGGPDNALYWIVSELVKHKKFDITIVATVYGIDSKLRNQYYIVPNREVLVNNIKVIYFELNSKNTFSPKLIFWLFRNIKKYELLFITSFFNHHSLTASFLCRFYRIPLILSPRGELKEPAFQFGNKNKHLKKLYLKIFSSIYKKATFQVTSQDESESVKKYFPSNRIAVLPNLIPLIDKPNFQNERKDIVFLGRLNPIKGIENLIKAYSELPKKLKEKHNLIIAGSGKKEYEEELKNSAVRLDISNNVNFIGHVRDLDKNKLLEKTLVLVLPSYSENFAIVILEAISLGTYVITSIYTPWKELKEKNLGSWIDNDPESIKQELEYIMNIPNEDYSDITKKAYEYVYENFDLEKNIHLYTGLIQKSFNQIVDNEY